MSSLVIFDRKTKEVVAIFQEVEINGEAVVNKKYDVLQADPDAEYIRDNGDGVLRVCKPRPKVINMTEWLEKRRWEDGL